MHLLDLTLPTVAANLALDEALLMAAEEHAGGEVLRFWHWSEPAVVLGAGGKIDDDVDVLACTNDGVPLARRSSGGGTVLLGRGCLLFTLVLEISRVPQLQQIRSSYRWILDRIATMLSPLQPGIEFAGISDLAVAGRKFSGNAQQRKRRFILHHGTLLCDFDLSGVGRYLKLPPRRPDYRGERDHAEFLINLPNQPNAIRECLQTGWKAQEPSASWPQDQVTKLVEEKYNRKEWIMRR